MNWLDSHFPTDADQGKPGVARGRCDPTAGLPKTVESSHPDASVVYSNIKVRFRISLSGGLCPQRLRTNYRAGRLSELYLHLQVK